MARFLLPLQRAMAFPDHAIHLLGGAVCRRSSLPGESTQVKEQRQLAAELARRR